jgi:flagellar export protein FliJ
MKPQSLNTLARVQRWEMDRLRQEMDELQNLRDQLTRRDDKLVHILEREAELASAGSGEADYAIFAQRINQQRESLTVSLAEVSRNMEAKQGEIQEVFQEIKRYEIVEERALKRSLRAVDRRDQARLDEIGQNIHRRKNSIDDR